jgi:hypothetical protein
MVVKRFCSLVVFVIVAHVALPAFSQIPDAEILRRSDIVVVGTVLKMGATLLPTTSSTQTFIVRVERILDKPNAVSLVPGDQITVQARDTSKIGVGARATFYTMKWIFADTIAVRELWHIQSDASNPQNPQQQQDELMQARRQMSDEYLKTRIKDAALIVVGKVTAVRPATLTATPASHAPVTEHDPQWREAIIHVESSIKGARPGQDVAVHFPGSIDVAWYDAPKLKEGQEGTFILHEDTMSGASKVTLAGKQVPAYLAIEPPDVLSKEDAARVKAVYTK